MDYFAGKTGVRQGKSKRARFDSGAFFICGLQCDGLPQKPSAGCKSGAARLVTES